MNKLFYDFESEEIIESPHGGGGDLYSKDEIIDYLLDKGNEIDQPEAYLNAFIACQKAGWLDGVEGLR